MLSPFMTVRTYVHKHKTKKNWVTCINTSGVITGQTHHHSKKEWNALKGT